MIESATKFLTFSLATSILVACSTFSPSVYKVEFDQDVSLLLENDQVKTVKRGEPLELPIAPTTITRGDHKTVVLIPMVAKEGTMRVRLPKEATNKEGRPDFGPEANKVAQSIIEIQNLLVEKRPDEALVTIQAVRARYPSFSYLTFLEASCFIAKNNVAKAQALVQEALREFPNDPIGREFMAQFSAGERTTP